jgi:transposase
MDKDFKMKDKLTKTKTEKVAKKDKVMQKAKCIVEYKYFTPSIRGVSKRQGVPKTTVHRWIKEDREANGILQDRKEYKKREITAKKQVMQCIDKTLQTRPFITMAQLASLLHNECGVTLSERTVTRYSTEACYTYKKAVTVVDHKHDNNQVKSFCERFITAYNAGILYCVDEAGFYVGDHPRKGRSKRGERLAVGTGKSLRKSKFSLGMAIGVNGIAGAQIMAHNYKKPDFVRFFSKIPLPRGSVILMDNLGGGAAGAA